MACRKRQRPSARDFFDRPPEPCAIENASNSMPIDFTLIAAREDNACPQKYLTKLESLDDREQIIELIRGKDRFDFVDSCSNDKHLFIIKSSTSDGEMKDRLELQHLATLLWGPGKKEVADGKAIYSGWLSFKVDDTRGITTSQLYVIEFSSQRSAELACGIVEFKLNAFLMSLEKDKDKPVLLVQTKIGSPRWLIQDPKGSMDEAKWRVIRKQVPFLRPLTKRESTPLKIENSLPEANRLAFEISQLPSAFTIPKLIENLLNLKLLNLPIQIKLTEEPKSDSPIRILLRFGDQTSAVICKINLYKFKLKLGECHQIKFLIDEGDSSVKDTWNIWSNATIWDEQQIQDFVKSHDRNEIGKSEDEIDELEEDTKINIEGSECKEINEFFESSDELSDSPHSTLPRRRGRMTYLQSLRQRQAETEKLIERFTVEVDEEYLRERDLEDGKSRSAFYNISEQVGEDKKYTKLMKQLRRRRAMRRELKNYRKKKPLPMKVKQQRKEWRRGQRSRENAIESGDGSGEEDSEDSGQTSDESDEPNERYLASCPQGEWERIRKKRRVRRVMEEKENSSNDADGDTRNKRLLTNDEVFQHKFSRPNEPLPNDVE